MPKVSAMRLTTGFTTPKKLLAATCVLGALQIASAMNYSGTDLLLVFRKDGQKDIEFDLGSISNYLGQAQGTMIPVPYNTNAVSTNFNNSVSGAKFALVAATLQTDGLPRVWITDATLTSAPADLSFSAFGVLRDKIESVGIAATIQTASNAAPYVVNTSASTSYDYLVTSGIGSAVTTMYGDSPVPVNGITPLPVDVAGPKTLTLYEVKINPLNPKPAARLVGAFTLDSAANLYFTAGVLPSLAPATITAIDVDVINESSTVSFTTTNGVSYRLLSSPSLSGEWTPVSGAGSVAGDGSVQSLTDYSALDPQRYYRVQSIY
jgi:hypothetical protein